MIISFEYYDEDTRNMLKERFTSEDEEYMKTIKDNAKVKTNQNKKYHNFERN